MEKIVLGLCISFTHTVDLSTHKSIEQTPFWKQKYFIFVLSRNKSFLMKRVSVLCCNDSCHISLETNYLCSGLIWRNRFNRSKAWIRPSRKVYKNAASLVRRNPRTKSAIKDETKWMWCLHQYIYNNKK